MIEAWLVGATYVHGPAVAKATHPSVNETKLSATIKRLRLHCPDLDNHLTFIVAFSPSDSAVRYASKAGLAAHLTGENVVLLCGSLAAYQNAVSKLSANPVSDALRKLIPCLK